MHRFGLKKVVKSARGKKQSVRRVYWVRSATRPQITPSRAKIADAAGWLTTSAINQAASYAGRTAGRAIGGMVGLALTPFLSPFAYTAAKNIGGFIGSSAAQLALRRTSLRGADWVERRIAGGQVKRSPRKFWLRGSGL